MERGCKRPECTVAQTGKCVLNRNPNECAERLPQGAAPETSQPPIQATIAPLPSPPEKPKLPNSQTLDLEQAKELMSSSTTTLVGVVGSPNSGKTAALVSMYLLLAHNRLAGFRYAYSRTLMALDEISRGARRWGEGKKPEHMTVHTEISADRGPGFMHLCLVDQNGRARDLLIPDLPGEWTDDLIDDNRTDHWAFLKATDVISIFVDGRELLTRRQYTTHRTKVLIQRVAALLSPRILPVVVAVSHRDALAPSEETIAQLSGEAARYGLPCKVIPIASFTNDGESIPAGFGIPELIQLWASPPSPRPMHFWPDVDPYRSDRMMLQYRNREKT